MPLANNRQKYGLNAEDRLAEIRRKFGASQVEAVLALLASVNPPEDRLLGAIIFLARDQRLEDIRELVHLANERPEVLLNAATVKDERA